MYPSIVCGYHEFNKHMLLGGKNTLGKSKNHLLNALNINKKMSRSQTSHICIYCHTDTQHAQQSVNMHEE